jgi:hypothetical protein
VTVNMVLVAAVGGVFFGAGFVTGGVVGMAFGGLLLVLVTAAAIVLDFERERDGKRGTR